MPLKGRATRNISAAAAAGERLLSGVSLRSIARARTRSAPPTAVIYTDANPISIERGHLQLLARPADCLPRLMGASRTKRNETKRKGRRSERASKRLAACIWEKFGFCRTHLFRRFPLLFSVQFVRQSFPWAHSFWPPPPPPRNMINCHKLLMSADSDIRPAQRRTVEAKATKKEKAPAGQNGAS